jgi:hypothetical protein
MKKTLIASTLASASLLALLPALAFAEGLGGSNLVPHFDGMGDAGVYASTSGRLQYEGTSTMNAARIQALKEALAKAQQEHGDGSTTAAKPPMPMRVEGSVKANMAVKGEVKMGNSKERADKEIDRRVANLNELLSRVSEMKNLTSDQKVSLTTSINTQISSLTTLKASIDADTSTTTLKDSVQSITKDYRIYMLVIPQGRIHAAADRTLTIVATMQQLLPKLQDRITAAATAGKDVTAAQSAYADMQVKLSDANVQAQAAVDETANLKPDNGDQAIATSNAAALKDAEAKLKTAEADLKAARDDMTKILKTVKGIGAEGTASTSVKASTDQ